MSKVGIIYGTAAYDRNFGHYLLSCLFYLFYAQRSLHTASSFSCIEMRLHFYVCFIPGMRRSWYLPQSHQLWSSEPDDI